MSRDTLIACGAGRDDFVTVAQRMGIDQWELLERAGRCGLAVINTRGKRWDVSEIAAVIVLRQKGVEWSVIAAAIGRTVAACNGYMIRLNRDLFSPADTPVTKDEVLRMKATGGSLTKAAASCGVERQQFRRICESYGIDTSWGFRPWTHREELEAIRLYHDGLSYESVGQELGRTRHAVWQKLKTLKVVKRLNGMS